MKSLNTEQSIRVHNKQVYDFNRYVNQVSSTIKRNPLEMSLIGFEVWFKLWLKGVKKIKDNNLYLSNLQSNYNVRQLYRERGKRKYNKNLVVK